MLEVARVSLFYAALSALAGMMRDPSGDDLRKAPPEPAPMENDGERDGMQKRKYREGGKKGAWLGRNLKREQTRGELQGRGSI